MRRHQTAGSVPYTLPLLRAVSALSALRAHVQQATSACLNPGGQNIIGALGALADVGRPHLARCPQRGAGVVGDRTEASAPSVDLPPSRNGPLSLWQPREEIMKSAATIVVAVVLAGLWLWGVVSYLLAGSIAAAAGAFFVPPIGVLHGAGLL